MCGHLFRLYTARALQRTVALPAPTHDRTCSRARRHRSSLFAWEWLLLGRLLLGGCRGFRGGSLVRVFLLEPLDAPGRIHELLLAGEKRVAVRADFHLDQ